MPVLPIRNYPIAGHVFDAGHWVRCDDLKDAYTFDANAPKPDADAGIEPPIYPSDPRYIGCVYFCKRRFGKNRRAMERVMAQYAADYPDHAIYPYLVAIANLADHKFMKSPKAERKFISRGHVSDFQDRQLPPGNGPDSAFAERHKAIVHATTHLLNTMIKAADPALLDTGHPWFNENDDCVAPRDALALFTGKDGGGERDIVPEIWLDEFEQTNAHGGKDGTLDLGAFLIAKHAEEEEHNIPLVEVDGLLLGRTAANHNDVIHMAHSGTPASFLRVGNGNYMSATSQEIKRRVALELTAEALNESFHPRHWPDSEMDRVGAAGILPGTVVAWYSQCLAALRKIAWRVAADESGVVLRNELLVERDALRAAGTRRRPLGSSRLPKQEPFEGLADALNAEIDRYIERIPGIAGYRASMDQVRFALSDRDLLIGKFNGMNYDFRNPEEAPDSVLEMARWLGQLRRHGTAILGGDFWDDFVEMVDRDPRKDLRNLLYSMLSQRAWVVVLNAAQEIRKTERVLEVTYRWSSHDQSWSASREANEIIIEGPMLFFPVFEAGFWKEKAQFIRDNGGFVAPILRSTPSNADGKPAKPQS